MNPQTKNIALARWLLPLKNNLGEAIPAFGVVKVSVTGAVGEETFYQAEESAAGSASQCVINGPVQVPDGGEGVATADFPAVALYDPADGTPNPGEEWGPLEESFRLHAAGSGFAIVGGADAATETVHVVRTVGGGGGGGTPTDIKLVLIEENIEGVGFDDPQVLLTEDDIDITAEELGDGMTVVFQDPPDDDPTENTHDEGFNTFPYERRVLKLKYFAQPTKTVITSGTMAGSASSSITLAGGASSEDGEYNGLWISVNDDGDRQLRRITDYNGTTKVADVSPDWSPSLDSGTTYSVEKRDPGYEEDEDGEPLKKLRLKTTITDVDDDPPVRVVRFDFLNVFYDKQEDFKIGKYDRTYYPDYDPSGAWPPPWVEEPNTFFKKKYYGYAIKVGSSYVLMVEFCEELPAPELPEEES